MNAAGEDTGYTTLNSVKAMSFLGQFLQAALEIGVQNHIFLL